jgi:hypothetical protein
MGSAFKSKREKQEERSDLIIIIIFIIISKTQHESAYLIRWLKAREIRSSCRFASSSPTRAIQGEIRNDADFRPIPTARHTHATVRPPHVRPPHACAHRAGTRARRTCAQRTQACAQRTRRHGQARARSAHAHAYRTQATKASRARYAHFFGTWHGTARRNMVRRARPAGTATPCGTRTNTPHGLAAMAAMPHAATPAPHRAAPQQH